MKKKMSKKTILIVVGIVLLLSITIGTALLSSILTIQGNTTIKENSWIIYFDSVRKSTDSVASNNDARITNYEKTRIDFSANLKDPGDFYEFTVYTVNDGTIDAMVDSVEKFQLTEEQLKYLEFNVTYDNGREIKRCDPLDAHTRKRIKAVVKFKEGVDAADYSGEDVNLDLFFNINYVQKDDACPPDPVGNEKLLTIRPHGGRYKGRTDETRVYLEPGATYTLEQPERYLYNFTGWETILPESGGTFTYDGKRTFTMGNEDVTLEAEWEEGAYVARIMNTYYTSVQEAFDRAADEWDDNTVYLLKNHNEDPINNTTTPFTFNLGGYTLTGQIINQKESHLRLINGRLQAETDQQEAIRNYGAITLGTQGGGVQVENSIAIIGNEVGLRNINKNGNYGDFYFYDGYIEAVAALVGGYSDLESGYFIFSEHIPERNDQRVYLVRNPNRAVAKTTTDGVIYYYNLQDAINQASINKRAGELSDDDYIISAVRNFEAAYKINVQEDETIIFDLDGHTISTGDTVTNKGNFTVKNTSQTAATIRASRTITNTANFNISNISIKSTADENTINNSGNLNLEKVSIKANDGYGINNTGNGTISLDENTIISSTTNYGLRNTASNLVLNNGTIYAIENTNKLTLTGNVNPKAISNYNPVYTSGTLILEQLEHTDTYNNNYIYCYGGSVTVNGGKLQNKGNVISGYSGTVTLNNVDIKSTDSSAIAGSYINTVLNSGKVESTSREAISSSGLTMNNGEVIGVGNGISVSNLTLINGSITSDGTGAYASSANIQGGTIDGVTYGLRSNSLTLSNGTITASEGIGVDTSSANISGGTINGVTHGLNTSSITMSNGNINASTGVGAVVTSSGTITGGIISGGTYGVQAKSQITLGTNDETISSTTPVLIGDLYGLYIEGNDINFYDGILKGQTDGYYGKITGLPTGGLVVDGTETIDEVLYQTDTVNAYRNWLQVGEEQFNNIESACEAIEETGTITVIDDVDIRFIQNFVKNNNVDRNITFDLNGHSITTTQPIYNHTNVTIVDSSDEKTGKITAARVRGLVNESDGTMTINAGTYETTTANVPLENRNRMIINSATTIATTLGLRNYGYLTINDASIEGSVTGIENNVNYNVATNCGTRGYIVINGGRVTATDTAIQKGSGTIVVNDGYVYGTSYGIGGSSGNALINGGLVKATTNNALYTYSGTLQVIDGQVISENNIAMLSHADMYVEGGYIEGTKGIQNEQYCSSLTCWYNDTYVSGGHIVGKTNEGINYKGDSTGILEITGGVVEGATNGVTTTAKVRLGANDGTVSTSTPVLIGHTTYGIKHTNYTEFYDGILKGVVDGRNGLVSIIPDAYLIKDDYEYIDRIEYQTDYLVEKGNWLRVGNKEFNSINKANQYITEENHTMTVIADAYIDFAQTINASYDVTFDFNGHSLIMTQPLKVNTNTRFTNSREVGGINNLRDNTIVINGGSTIIDAGVYHSDTTTTITNSGNLTINGGEIKADYNYALSSGGTLTVNGGLISGENNAVGVTASSSITINGGTIQSEKTTGLSSNNSTTIINNGTITSGKATALSAYNTTLTINNGLIQSSEATAITTSNSTYNSTYVTINGGEIIGNTYGIQTTHYNGSTTINGGHIVGETTTGVYASSTTYINGGNIEGGQYGVNALNSDTITQIGNNDGTINIDAPSIKGDLYGLYISNSSTVNFYDGIIKGITDRHYGVITNIASHAQIFEDEEIINDQTYKTEYLVTETEIVINEDTQVTYGNLQTAITQAQEGETLRLLTNVPLYYEIDIGNHPNITLNMDGKIISTNKRWRITVPFTLTNTSENESTLKISTAVNLINGNSDLTINNVTLKNTSSSNYVINTTGKLSLNNVKIDCINGVQSTNELNIISSTINATKTTISNTGKLTITGGTYTGSNYSLYSNSNKSVSIAYATFNGVFYNSGSNTAILSDSLINGNLQNNTSDLTVTRSNIRIGRITNNGTLALRESTFTATTSDSYYYYQEVAMSNTGTATIDHSNIFINREAIGKTSAAISNTGTLNVINDSKVYIGMENSSYSYHGINTTSNGLTNIENSEIKVNGGTTSYGLYIDGQNAKAILLTGAVRVEEATTSYGVYNDKGTFEMGHYEGLGVTSEDVSITNPLVYSVGRSRGIGVKKINASFNFYDGIIRASKYAKPETTTNVEYQFEVTTYVDKETGYEYAILEWMRNDYEGDTVCILNDVYYKSIQDAIDKAEAGDEITLLKSIEEDFSVPTNKNVKLNLNQHSITTNVINNGTLNVYNGSLQSFDSPTINNRGTLILGENDGTVSSSNIRIVSETTTIHSTGTITMYDGYIEGTKAIEGKINNIAQYARIRTVTDEQSEKKFIQSLSPEAIMNGDTDLIVTVDPNTGVYEGSTDIKEIFRKYQETYTLSEPTKRGCDFVGWEVDEDAIFDEETSTITVSISDVYVKALWEVSPNAVAKIGDDYFLSLQEALDNANDGDEVELLKDVTEDITNRANARLDLGGYTVTGAFINQGELRVLNGTIENLDGPGMINQKLLTMGENDGEIHEDNIKIIGTTIGLQQDAKFRFYDGFIEGDIALNGKVDAVPQGYFLYNDRNNIKNCQRVYLIGNPSNAVAVIDNGGTQYFFSLQSAIDTAAITGDEIYIVRDFEAAYPITVSENTNILINMNSYNITTGNTIVNNGTLRIYDPSEDVGSITTAKAIQNNGTLSVENIKIKQNTSATVIENSGTLNLVAATIEASSGYAVKTSGPFTMDANSLVTGTGAYSFYNNYDGLVLSAGEINSIYNAKTLTLEGDVFINSKHSNAACVHTTTANAKLIMNGGICSAENIGISMQGTGESFELNGGTITSKKQGLYVNNTSGANSTTITDGSITSTSSYGIYFYGRSHSLTIDDGLIKSNSSSAIWLDSWSSSDSYKYPVTINGGEINGGDYGAVFYYTKLDINGGTFITRSTNRDRYAIWYYYGKNSTIKNATLTADNASGIYVRGYTHTLENVYIESSAASGYGIYMEDTTINVNTGTKIITNGLSSNGVIMASNSNTHTVNVNGGEIKSANVGINTNTSNYTRTININSGRVSGNTYGVYEQVANATVNIGNTTNDLSIEQPLVTGGLYGVYKTAGTFNFYNGVLRGHIYGYNGEINKLRKSKEITEETEDSRDEEGIATYSTIDIASEPTENYAKVGDGYARITYIGEEDDICLNGQTWEFPYSGVESVFTPVCSGKYKLEVWGAQGGNGQTSSNSIGGYGGYATGEITLSNQEILYINVGGQGENNTNQSGTSLGGYNGGGRGYRAGGGGGATHIASTSGLLSTLSNNKESIIIVAGGGGGGAASRSTTTSRGGSGGGFKGENGYKEGNICNQSGDNRCAIAGNQTSGGITTYGDSNATYRGKFGAGGDAAYFTVGGAGAMGGGGAGYYGGSGTYDSDSDLDSGGGAGGSGFIGNSRLSNISMYGYNVPTTYYTWIKNYLIEKDVFLQVEEETFNSIDNAVNYIVENLNSIGTMKVIKDATMQEDSTILENTTITLDLNGKVLQTTRPVTNNGILTIIDSTEDKNGMLYCKQTNPLINHNNLHVVNGTIQSDNASGILGNTNEGTLTIDEGVIVKGTTAVNTSTKYTINITKATLIGSTNGLTSSGAQSNITLDEVNITGTNGQGAQASGNNSTLTITNSTITSKVDAINTNGNSTNLTVTGSTINGTSSPCAIYSNNSTVNLSNTSFTGSSYGIYLNSYKINITVTNCNVKATGGVGIHDVYSSNSGGNDLVLSGGTVEGTTHGMYTYYTRITTSNVTIKTTSTNKDYYCIYTYYNNPAIILNEGTKLYAPTASGLRNVTNTTINDVEIKAEGTDAYGIVNNDNGNLKIYGGTIYGKKYGIYQNNANATTTLGNSTTELSIESPLITSDQYGLYKTAGTTNIYSGRLKGNTESYHGEFNKARKGYKVYTFDEIIDEENPDVTRKVSYLSETENFLQVGDDPENVFNTFEDAIASITNDTETIKVLNDNLVYEVVTFPAGKNITLDLNDHTLTMTQTIVNNGTLTIVGGEDIASSAIKNNTTEGISNKGTLNITDASIITSGVTLRATDGTNPVTIENSIIKGSSPIRMDKNQLLTITDSTIEATNGHAIYQNASNQKTIITNCKIKSTDQGVVLNASGNTLEVTNSTIDSSSTGINQNSTNQTVTVKSSKVYGNTYGVYSVNSGNKINISENTKVRGGDIGLYQNTNLSSSYAIININDSEVTGGNYGVYVRGAELNTTNTTIEVTIASRDRYAAVCEAYGRCNFNENTILDAKEASGLYVNTNYSANLNGVTIESNIANAYGVYAYDGTVNINEGTTINVPGYQAYGVYQSHYDAVTNVNGGEIYSGNIGIFVGCERSDTKKLNVNKGKIVGETYGISTTCTNNTVTVGNLNDEVSITDPYVEGGLISINKTAGILNFYSGLLKGYIRGNPGTVDGVRTGYEIFDDEDEAQIYIRSQKTISTTDHSETPIANNAKEGNGYARLTYEEYTESAATTEDYTIVDTIGSPQSSSAEIHDRYEFEYTGSIQELTLPVSGTYKLEVWGAQGGSYNSTSIRGGYGSYSVGYIELEQGTDLFVAVGGQGRFGNNTRVNGGFNGGGFIHNRDAGGNGSGSGGGATHIALEDGELKSLKNNVEDVLIVAGGGGGSVYGNDGGHSGGDAGGYVGKSSVASGYSYATGGTQIAGGSTGNLNNHINTVNSGFGQGAGSSGNGNTWYGGGGGGGFYGGGYGGTHSAGAGGSGYIGNDNLYDKEMTCFNCSSSDLESQFTYSTTNYSSEPIADYAKTGDGYAVITYLGGTDVGAETHTVTLMTDYGTIANPELIYSDGAVLGNIPQPVVDNNTMEFKGWFTSTKYNRKVTENTEIYMSTTLYAKFEYKDTYCSSIEGVLVTNFDYTGTEQDYDLPCSGKYKLELWGAQGGNTTYNSYSNTGGYGGYTVGHVSFEKDEKIYIYVGGQGNGVTYQQSEGTYTFDSNTGFNGGGKAVIYTNNSSHAGGGGATHIATKRGHLVNFAQNKKYVIMVAGGGGGASTHSSYPSYSGDGGSGGGAIAGSGITSNTTCYNYGTGGTQNTGGSFVACANDGRTSRDNAPAAPTFGQGSNYTATSTSATYSGGGAGWYGGQSGWHAPGGGGSSYLSRNRVEEGVMYGYNVEEAYLDNKSNIAYLIEQRDLIENLTTNETYVSLQDAIDEADSEDTLQYIANDYISYEVEIPLGKNITIDMNGYNIVTSKKITNNGTLKITNSSQDYTSKITNNASVTQIINNSKLTLENIKLDVYNGVDSKADATLTLDNTEINARNNGINNAGKMTIEGSIIYGPTYDIYSSSTKTELISNTTLKSSSNAYYKYDNGDTTITDSTVKGTINNARSGQPLEVKDSVLNCYIRNTGTSIYDNNEITASVGNESNYLILNSGILTLTNNDIEYKSTTTSTSNYTVRALENNGTVTSTNNDYLVRYDYNASGTYSTRARYLYGIRNYALLTSTDDEFTTIGGQNMYGVYNSSSNNSTVRNATITQYHGTSYNYGIYNESGNISFINSSIELYDAYSMYGLYQNAGTVNLSSVNMNIHNSNNSSSTSYGAYIKNGLLTYDNGTMALESTYKGYGTFIAAGSFEFKHGNIVVTGNNESYGVYLNDSSVTYTQGIYDGRGTEDSDVSISNPSITAIGSTTGIGVRMGGGTFNYYDGYITGSTSPRAQGDITSATELNYQVVTKTDEETGYNYCILEYNK